MIEQFIIEFTIAITFLLMILIIYVLVVALFYFQGNFQYIFSFRHFLIVVTCMLYVYYKTRKITIFFEDLMDWFGYLIYRFIKFLIIYFWVKPLIFFFRLETKKLIVAIPVIAFCTAFIANLTFNHLLLSWPLIFRFLSLEKEYYFWAYSIIFYFCFIILRWLFFVFLVENYTGFNIIIKLSRVLKIQEVTKLAKAGKFSIVLKLIKAGKFSEANNIRRAVKISEAFKFKKLAKIRKYIKHVRLCEFAENGELDEGTDFYENMRAKELKRLFLLSDKSKIYYIYKTFNKKKKIFKIKELNNKKLNNKKLNNKKLNNKKLNNKWIK